MHRSMVSIDYFSIRKKKMIFKILLNTIVMTWLIDEVVTCLTIFCIQSRLIKNWLRSAARVVRTFSTSPMLPDANLRRPFRRLTLFVFEWSEKWQKWHSKWSWLRTSLCWVIFWKITCHLDARVSSEIHSVFISPEKKIYHALDCEEDKY